MDLPPAVGQDHADVLPLGAVDVPQPEDLPLARLQRLNEPLDLQLRGRQLLDAAAVLAAQLLGPRHKAGQLVRIPGRAAGRSGERLRPRRGHARLQLGQHAPDLPQLLPAVAVAAQLLLHHRAAPRSFALISCGGRCRAAASFRIAAYCP